ncbi:MAG: hypothetical protein PHW02_08955 [bacterium]|nr:hypothetical protein [bacterium]
MARFFFILIVLAFSSCSLFAPSVLQRSEILGSGSAYSDSIILDESGAYTIYLSSDYALDVFFFDSKTGFDLFRNEGLLYSEYIYYPLSFANATYIDDVFNTFEENTKLYFVIDNTNAVTSSKGNAYYTIEIKKI